MDDMKLALFLLSAVAMFAGLLDATGSPVLDATTMTAGAAGAGLFGRLVWADSGR